MMLRAHTCAHARASSGTMSPPFVLCVLCAALRGGGDRRARSRRTTYMPLCTRSEVYIRLVCPGIGLSQGAATTRVQSKPPARGLGVARAGEAATMPCPPQTSRLERLLHVAGLRERGRRVDLGLRARRRDSRKGRRHGLGRRDEPQNLRQGTARVGREILVINVQRCTSTSRDGDDALALLVSTSAAV